MEYIDAKKNAFLLTHTPLPGYTLPNLLCLLAQNKFLISPRYLPRFVYCLCLSSIMAPFTLKERIQCDTRIHHTAMSKPPVFLLGHWRSGTTYLQNLLSQDSQFGFFSTFQAYLPAVFLSSEAVFKPLVSSSIPKQRPMDGVAMDAEFPQEDQYAVGAFSPYSYYHGWCFPRGMERYNTYVCMQDVSQRTIEDWKQIYRYLLQKITLYHNGKQLVLKNQDNTAKIRLLLELFPDAKFVFLYRNPYDLYFSMMKFISIVLPRYCVQTPPPLADVEHSMLKLYSRMIHKYLTERRLIPPENLLEVRYEDFISHPLDVLQRMYPQFTLEGFEKVRPAFVSYLATQKHIQTDHYTLTKDVQQKIDEHWGFAVKEFGYQDTH